VITRQLRVSVRSVISRLVACRPPLLVRYNSPDDAVAGCPRERAEALSFVIVGAVADVWEIAEEGELNV
jgi:hypothetical protein